MVWPTLGSSRTAKEHNRTAIFCLSGFFCISAAVCQTVLCVVAYSDVHKSALLSASGCVKSQLNKLMVCYNCLVFADTANQNSSANAVIMQILAGILK